MPSVQIHIENVPAQVGHGHFVLQLKASKWKHPTPFRTGAWVEFPPNASCAPTAVYSFPSVPAELPQAPTLYSSFFIRTMSQWGKRENVCLHRSQWTSVTGKCNSVFIICLPVQLQIRTISDLLTGGGGVSLSLEQSLQNSLAHFYWLQI